MKTTLAFCLLLLAETFYGKAQNLIAVQNGSEAAFYTSLDSAIVHAQNGDTVYIPGGNFSITVPVEKRLYIIGVGYNIDSTLATGKTQINGELSILLEASNGSLTGVYLSGSIYSVGNISNYLVQRCRIGGLKLSSSFNWSFIENNIQVTFQNSETGASNCFFANNIIDAYSYTYGESGFTASIFKNNIFTYSAWDYGYGPIKATSSIFENNIIFNTKRQGYYDNAGSAFYNNLFVVADPFYWCPGCWGSNNIVGQDPSTIFGTNYHLQPTSPGKNAGKDGTDIGIYGGAFPWKAGSVPSNPHIQFENVSGIDNAGNIHVVVKVAAQDR